MSTRYQVVESFGYGHRAGVRMNESTAPRSLAASTVRGMVRDLRAWASGYADMVQDTESAGSRLVTAHHWVNGFENVRQLRITPA